MARESAPVALESEDLLVVDGRIRLSFAARVSRTPLRIRVIEERLIFQRCIATLLCLEPNIHSSFTGKGCSYLLLNQ